MKTYFYIIFEINNIFCSFVRGFQHNPNKSKEQELSEQCFLFLENKNSLSIIETGFEECKNIGIIKSKIKNKVKNLNRERNEIKIEYHYLIEAFIYKKGSRQYYIFLNSDETIMNQNYFNFLKNQKNCFSRISLESGTLLAFDDKHAEKIIKSLDFYKKYKNPKIII